ncbi:MAG: RHS repeat-associated core domain-containing protein, partial [Acidimicrobiales bacterium]
MPFRAGQRWWSLVVVVALLVVACSSGGVELGRDLDPPRVTYAYDEAGRLRWVSTPGDAAVFSFDAAGNVTGVGRYDSPEDVLPVHGPDRDPAPTIHEVSPRVVAVGDTVTIRGEHFSEDWLLDAVSIGETAYAAVEAASASVLRATVGATATSGRVAVGTPGGRAESTDEVFVVPFPFRPGDVGPAVRVRLGASERLEIGSGEVALVVLAAQPGQTLEVELAGGADDFGCGLGLGLVDPYGVELRSAEPRLATEGCEVRVPELRDVAVGGTYTLVVNPLGGVPGSFTVTVREAGSDDGRDEPPSERPAPSTTQPPRLAGVDPAVFVPPVPPDVGVRRPPGGMVDGPGEFPVDLATGMFVLDAIDLVVGDGAPLGLTRTYFPSRPDDPNRPELAFGVGSPLALEVSWRPSAGFQYADLVTPAGAPVGFVRTTPGVDAEGAVFGHKATSSTLYGSQVAWNGTGWDLTLGDGTTLVFGSAGDPGVEAKLRAVRDRFGPQLSIQREGDQFGRATGRVTSIQTRSGRSIRFAYDRDRIVEARDDLGRSATYRYDDAGRLGGVAYSWGDAVGYGYDDRGRLHAVTDVGGAPRVTMDHDDAGRVVRQRRADGSVFSFAYTTDADGQITHTDVTDPRGMVRRVAFAAGYWVSDTVSVGTPQAATVIAERDDEGFVAALVGPDQRRVSYRYDPAGRLTSVSTVDDAGAAVSTRLGYDLDSDRVAEVTDPSGVTRLGYDDAGSLVALDRDGLATAYRYDRQGRLTSVTTPDGSSAKIAYELSHRVTITDRHGTTASGFFDAGGRLAVATDATGHRTRFAYDDLDRVVSITDPAGGETAFGYDTAGRVSSLRDAGGNTTRWGYDTVGRVISRTDPTGAVDHYGYDGAGQLTSVTDRRGVVSAFTYDPRGRPTVAAFGVTSAGVGSTIAYAYDPAGRLAEVDDSSFGLTTFAYDALDRLVGEASPAGEITYGYDAAGRRTTMGLPGVPPTAYGYDDTTGRLASITNGDSVVAAHRADDGRVSAVDLPNGVTARYQWDDASRLTAIEYGTADHPHRLGRLTYHYDSAGRQTGIGGDLASLSVPAATTTVNHDPANRLTAWNDTQLQYDAAGNLVADGSNTYTWNARGELVAIDGPVSARFTYDPFGRRATKRADGVTSHYLYDGANIAQQRHGDNPPVTYLSGPALDEIYARIDPSGAATTHLRDAQGSVIGLVGPDGTTHTGYRYGPYGETRVDGVDDLNPFAYTGRELDETGLYYYRARYYHPETGRFLSQDPIGFAGGDPNLYRYAGGDPVNFVDPTGTTTAAPCLATASASLATTFDLGDQILAVIHGETDGLITRDAAAIALDNLLHAAEDNLNQLLIACGAEILLTPGLLGMLGRAAGFGRSGAAGPPRISTPIARGAPNTAGAR